MTRQTILSFLFRDRHTLETLHADSLVPNNRTGLINDGHGNDGETPVAAASVPAIIVEYVNVVCGGPWLKTPKSLIESRGGELRGDELRVAREILRQIISEGAEVGPDLFLR